MSSLVLTVFCGTGGEQDLEKGQKSVGRGKQRRAAQGEGGRGGIEGSGVTIILLHAAAPGSQQVAAQVLMTARDDTNCCWVEPSGTACKHAFWTLKSERSESGDCNHPETDAHCYKGPASLICHLC